MQSSKLEAILEDLNLTDEKADQLRSVLKEMLSHTKDVKDRKPRDAKLILMAKLVEETDWRKRAGIAAGIISLDL